MASGGSFELLQALLKTNQKLEWPLSTTGLEVLACVAFKQPLFLPELNGCFSIDKRSVVLRLHHLGLVDCRTAGKVDRTVG